MTKNEIITACSRQKEMFEKTLISETYQLRGIFNSEALLIVSIAKLFGVSHLIESGRARGHSTNIFAKFFSDEPDFKITSIDYDNTSEDTKYSEKYLAKYTNLELIYGDSNLLINPKITEDCVIFIDGPKGDGAIQLAAELLKNKRVKAVLVHDLHKDTFHRNICEAVFTDSFFSDDDDFVAKFKYLDENCWQVLNGTGETPYQRYGKPISSYASTVGLFFNSNSPLVEPAFTNYKRFLTQHKPTFKNTFIETFSHDSVFYKGILYLYKKLR